MQLEKDNLVTENLDHTKDISKPLTEFDDALFEAMVEKVIIKSTTEFEFIFESGQKSKGESQ